MGPAGWMKCPLRSTNKRFLLNTLRSTGLQRRPSGPAAGEPTTRGRPRSVSQSRDSRSRNRTPPRHHRANGGHTDYKYHHRDSGSKGDKRHDRDKGKREDNKEQRHRKHSHDRDSDTHRLNRGGSPGEGRSLSGRQHSAGSSHSCSPPAPRRSRSRSPAGDAHDRRRK
ncbi:protein POLR1D isoform X2 [Myripristis murdjan]|nr:protein POLR1D isoform X2 [Myripristis murdjan]